MALGPLSFAFLGSLTKLSVDLCRGVAGAVATAW